MIYLPVEISLPFLWENEVFKKSDWNSINLFVGPNGSGKTIIAGELFKILQKEGYKPDFLLAERLITETDSSPDGKKHRDVFRLLKADSLLKEKVETVISAMFKKSIYLDEKNGHLIPMVKDIVRNSEYNLRKGECHGLKEIITLLTTIYDSSSKSIILDEPELHLHPQFQFFLINEIRKLAGNPLKDPGKKLFFIITHSPYFIDLRSPEDFRGIVLCHTGGIPTYCESPDLDDFRVMKRFLPRFNTHHKQFFFSDNPVFVEGYTDQQVFTILIDSLSLSFDYPGSCIIDVGGKDELGVFYTICRMLGTGARIITDLDSLFKGKLRDVLCADSRPRLWLNKEGKELYPEILLGRKKITLASLIQQLEGLLIQIGRAVSKINSRNHEVQDFVQRIGFFYSSRGKVEDLDTFKTVLSQGLELLGDKLVNLLPEKSRKLVPLCIRLKSLILRAGEKARVYILPRGCIEHYYTQTRVEYMPISGKDKLFHQERDYLISQSPKTLREEYPELIGIIQKALD